MGSNNGNGFKPGQKRPPNGGRKPGVRNKDKQKVWEILDGIGHDPLKAIHEDLPKLEPKDRVAANIKLLDFIYPKRRAEDAAGDTGEGAQAGAAVVIAYTPEQIAEFIKVARTK